MKYSCGHCGKEKPTEFGMCTSCGRFSTQIKGSVLVFTLFWRGGHREIVQGNTIADALRIKGYDEAAIKGLAFYVDGNNDEYAWSYNANRWDRKMT